MRAKLWFALYVVLALAAGTATHRWDAIDAYEAKSYDHRLVAASPETRDPRIVVVTIDDESFKRLKKLPAFAPRSRWPWPVPWHQQVMERLFAEGAAVVAFDLLSFDSPSPPAYAAEDEAFAEACGRHAGRVVLAERYDLTTTDGMSREEWFLPLKMHRKHARRGYVNVLRHRDGVIREFMPRRKRMEIFQEDSFSFSIALAYLLATGQSPELRFDAASIRFGEKGYHLDGEGRALIPLTRAPLSPSGNPPSIPYWKVLAGEPLPEKLLDGAIVLVGPTAVDLHDRHASPLTTVTGKGVDGVAVQADLVNGWLHGSPLRRPAPTAFPELSFYAALIGFAIALFAGALWGPPLLLAGAFAWWGFASALMARHGLWIDVARPFAVAIAVYLVVVAARLAFEERARRRIRGMFSAYVSPEVLSFLELHPEAFRLAGERRDVTVFFSDVQGFTDMSETVSPEELALILNDYFTPMSELVMAEGGYVDKYIGDCIMAVFGAPGPLEDHALRCCRSALAQLDALETLNGELEARYGKRLAIRIGISSGEVSAGNMGSRNRFEYTVMGDVVNLGSRLEGANKVYGTRIMVSGATHALVKDAFHFRFLDRLRVKGKAEAVEVWELLGPAGEVPKEKVERAERFRVAWEAHRERDWDCAIALYEELAAEAPGEKLAPLYLERCRGYRDTPPPEDWQGEHVMTSK